MRNLIPLTSLFCILLLISGLTVSYEASTLVTVSFLDVGQGDSIFIDTDGLDVLIDGGPRSASATLMNYLNGLGVSQIDFVAAHTHLHEDHIGGLITVLGSSITVTTVLYNGEVATTQLYSDFMSLAQGERGIAERGKVYVLDARDCPFDILLCCLRWVERRVFEYC